LSPVTPLTNKSLIKPSKRRSLQTPNLSPVIPVTNKPLIKPLPKRRSLQTPNLSPVIPVTNKPLIKPLPKRRSRGGVMGEDMDLDISDTEKINIIDRHIEGLVGEFNKCCDELIGNRDGTGVLNKYIYISNVINSIIIVLYTKFQHLPYYYNELARTSNKSNLEFKVFMYDEKFSKYCVDLGLDPVAEFQKPFYGNMKVSYQKHDLTKEANHTNINLDPKTVNQYHLNTLLNRQHVFEASRYDPPGDIKHDMHSIQYNQQTTSQQINKSFNEYTFPGTLNYAKEIINELNINYNITNSLLPKTIFCVSTDATINTNNPFSELIKKINDRLSTLPTITRIAKEATIKKDYYEAIIKSMKSLSFGKNDIGYGGDNMIRKNILYSLNAQFPTYIIQNMDQHKKDIYYNYEYTGIFPLFTWIPLNHNDIGSSINQKYSYPHINMWQPFDFDPRVLSELDLSYKNRGIAPFSLNLNVTIYKVLTDEYASVNSLIVLVRVQGMTNRIIKTVGAYKDKIKKADYENEKIYLYHGAKNRLHSIGGKGEEIEVLGFLSTSLNVYVASFYSGVGTNNVGLIYIIEVDETHSYINLKDNINQILILPQSKMKIIMEFNVGGVCVILCRLFETPTVKQNSDLYDKLLGQTKVRDINETYIITANANVMPKCASLSSDLWKTNKAPPYKEDLEIYKVSLNDQSGMSDSDEIKEFLYFSLGKEYELYVDRGIPLISGSLEDIKYSIHQHFIKDCYKALDIPCIDYIFIHSIVDAQFDKSPICTGISLTDYENNRTNQYKYDINNFLIDTIFMFNSIKHDNKKLDLQEEQRDGKIYADKIEGFRDAGAYLNGFINPLFKKGSLVGEHIQYMRDWKHLLIKYKEAREENIEKLIKHFKWCNKRITDLMEIISDVSKNYLVFIEETLKRKTGDQQGSESEIWTDTEEYKELFDFIKNLEEILLERASFYQRCTQDDRCINDFITVLLSEDIKENTHNSKLYEGAILEELFSPERVSGGKIKSIPRGVPSGILETNSKIDRISGIEGRIGKIRFKAKAKVRTRQKYDTYIETQIDHKKIYEAFKNVPISESKDMRKMGDIHEDIREYYGITVTEDNKNEYINISNISNNCLFRFVVNEDVDMSTYDDY
jgi:hypothetical protein